MKTVFLFVDGCRYDYLERMPFLKKLASEGGELPLEVEPLHQFEFSIFSSQYQKNHNKWCWFYLDPKNSPFKWIKPFSGILKLIDSSLLRKFITNFSSLIMYFKKETRFVPVGKIPFNKLILYSATAKKAFIDNNPSEVPTLFDILRENKISYYLCEWPLVSYGKGAKLKLIKKNDKSFLNILKKNSDKDFLFAHLTDLDHLMHRTGAKSKEVFDYLIKLDSYIEDFYNYINKYGGINFIVCSDHGMVDIKGKVDVMNILSDIDKSKYEGFFDSTTARFWFKDKDLAGLIKSRLSKLNGKTFDKSSFSKIPLTYNNPYTSDLMFVANPGYQISPNYFDGNNLNKAMHGYLPCKEENALFLINKKLKKKSARIIDICPTILDILKIKKPKSWKGNSFI